MTEVKINGLKYLARCFLKTKIHLNQRSFSDFTIEELNDYASCIYDLGKMFHIDFKEFSLNRIDKKFEFIPTISDVVGLNITYSDIDKWEWFYSFLQYLFNVEGSAKFEYLTGLHYAKLTDNNKKKLNRFAEKFCECAIYDLWDLFDQHKIVKQKVFDYFCEVGIVNKEDN